MMIMQHDRLKKYQSLRKEILEMMDREPTEDEMNDAVAGDPELGNFSAKDFESFEIDQEEEAEVELRFRMGVSNMNLVKARAEKGLTQLDMARLLGMTTAGSYGHIETLKHYPSEEVKQRIADALGKSKKQLFPQWLEIFTNRWERTEKQRTVKLRSESLSSPEVAGLLAQPSDMQQEAERQILKSKLYPILQSLNERERKIIDMRFGLTDGVAMTLEEVGKEFDVTRERIRHIEAMAMEKLLNDPNIGKLSSYFMNA